MATSLTAKPVRATGTASRYAGLPKIPSNTPVATVGDRYPSSRIVRRSSVVSSLVSTPTWIAQAHSGNTKVCLVSGAGAVMSGYTVDPTAVDYASVTKTYRRPGNPNGGKPRYAHVLGDAEYTNAVGGVLTQTDVAEDRQSLLTGQNTWTESRKLPPLTTLSLVAPQTTHVYSSGTLGAIYAIGVESPVAFRYLGGSVTVGGVNPSVAPASLTVSVYAFPVDPGTLTASWAGRLLLGTMVLVPFVPNSITLTQAQMITAGVVRWNQFFLVVTAVGAPAPCFSTYSFRAPLDVPPPYDCAGVDSFIHGGLLT